MSKAVLWSRCCWQDGKSSKVRSRICYYRKMSDTALGLLSSPSPSVHHHDMLVSIHIVDASSSPKRNGVGKFSSTQDVGCVFRTVTGTVTLGIIGAFCTRLKAMLMIARFWLRMSNRLHPRLTYDRLQGLCHLTEVHLLRSFCIALRWLCLYRTCSRENVHLMSLLSF